jgi:hypothetical protein
VIVVGAENTQRLLEGQLDLEAQSIAADDIDGRESQVGGEEDAAVEFSILWPIISPICHST